MRLLTRAEYLASLQSLFGTVTTPLDLPEDTSMGGFVSIGASQVYVNQTAVERYESASRAVVAEVFGDEARWQALVGCEPPADLSDACLETFVRSFGKRAYRRDLSDAEVESGQLDTAEGVQTVAASMLSGDALVGQLTSFFHEYTQADLAMLAAKDPALFPDFNDSLVNSMREGTRLFFEKVVLAPGADVRVFFDSDQTFADVTLAPIYELEPPAFGFAQYTLPPESGRAGIMGQAAILAGHSKPDHSSPTSRGLFMMRAFFCREPLPPTQVSEIPVDATLTTRERLERETTGPACEGCHAEFDPMGFALEHFDAIGRYRETENGLAIDASGTLLDGTQVNGARELGAALRGSATVTECLLRNFYRSVNGRTDDAYDQSSIDGMVASLTARGYVFRDLVADFVASDAFRSAPALPVTEE
jgi:hypothetical protein